ncbi:MAG TPA: aminoglycoside phosphotransferase family protein [Pyrinomonadaceae bacterium]|jgi:streptomycin 6-kinase
MIGEIPTELVKNVRALCGDEADPWLAGLPDVVAQLEFEWSIEVGETFIKGEYNYVARATDRRGVPCVIKIAPPRSDRDHYSEAKYLAISNGDGAVRLFANDRERMAMLIERATPGQTLTQVFDGNERASVEPAIAVLKGTTRRLPDDTSEIILLDDWFDGLRRHPDSAFPAPYAEKALGFYESLSLQTERIGYLHGDFHPDNIVSAARSPFLLIDPKGIIGHLGYDIAVFLNNLHWWQEDYPDVKNRLSVAIRQFSGAFGISSRELRQWAFAQMVLGAWWTFDEMPNLYDNEVAKADIWDV